MGMYNILGLKGDALIEGLTHPLQEICKELGRLYYKNSSWGNRESPEPLFNIKHGLVNIQELHLSQLVFVIHDHEFRSNQLFSPKDFKDYSEALKELITQRKVGHLPIPKENRWEPNEPKLEQLLDQNREEIIKNIRGKDILLSLAQDGLFLMNLSPEETLIEIGKGILKPALFFYDGSIGSHYNVVIRTDLIETGVKRCYVFDGWLYPLEQVKENKLQHYLSRIPAYQSNN